MESLPNFSLRDWLDDGKPGTLFITWQEEMKRSLNPLISCWLDSILSIVLGMGEKGKR
ncbi:type IV secretion system DNA-binding domain-containing protein (plasmid) [Enterobacter roggenkampii]|uniref:type IV secretion system DNA-binding domain-containing protein n=1 Tax=Enterobacter roggenkampii TaxID=1812935 RepID=UPI0032AF64D7